ncbi:MAG: type II toxin-antitoxin system VapC family toxin, partial [Desulfobacterales bacterium]
MIVADTNLIAYFFIKGDFTDQADAVFHKDPEWAAPLLWRSKFRNVLSLYIRKGFINLVEAVDLMQEAELFMNGMEFLVPSLNILKLTEESKCSAYDCEFVILAEQFGLRLVTSDSLLLKKFPGTAVHMS